MFARNTSLFALFIALVACSIAACQDYDTALPGWIAQLRDPAPTYRVQAATKLGALGETASPALPALFDRLQDIEPDVRLAAVQALALIGTKPLETAKQLIPLLDDSDEHVRYAAEWATARIALANRWEEKPADIKQVLEAALAHIKLRKHHQRHLQVIEEALSQLTDIAKSEEDAAARLAEDLDRRQRELQAREAEIQREASLARQALLAAQAAKSEQDLLDELHDIELAFELSDSVDQLRIIHQLASMRDVGSQSAISEARVRILKQAIMRSESASVRFALNVWEDGREVVKKLFDSVPAESELPSWTGAVLLETLPDTVADTGKLISIIALADNPLSVRAAAVDALGRSKCSTPVCVDSLLRIAMDRREDSLLRVEAVRSLCKLAKSNTTSVPSEQAANVRDSLLGVLRDTSESWSIRSAAAHGLSQIAPSEIAVEVYVEAARLKELGDNELRSVVAVLADFGESAARMGEDFVARGLRSSDESTRIAAAEAVAKFGRVTHATASLLFNLLDDPAESRLVRLAVVRALAVIGPDAISQLGRRVLESSEASQVEMLEALSELGADSAPAMESCVRLIADDTRPLAVRCAAISVAGAVRPVAWSLTASSAGVSSKDVQPADIWSAGAAIRGFLKADAPASARATAFVALAKIEGGEPQLAYLTDSDLEQPPIQVATKFVQVMSGNLNSLEDLVSMLQGDAARYAATALEDIGPAARQPLVDVLQDQNASPDQRVRAFEILTRISDKDYRPLMSALADDRIGQRCQMRMTSVLGGCDSQLMSELMFSLSVEQRAEPKKRFRDIAASMASRVRTATSENEVRSVGRLSSALLDDVMAGAVITASSKSAAGTASAVSVFDEKGLIESDPKSLAFPGFPLAGGESRSEPPQPRRQTTPDRALDQAAAPVFSGAERAPPSNRRANSAISKADSLPSGKSSEGQPATVKVFYGTNRAPLALEAALRANLPSAKPITVLIAIAALAVCFFGFLRKGAVQYALFAMVGLGCVAVIGLRRPENADVQSSNKQPAVPYGTQYSDRLALGICEVSIPPGHMEGELESPSLVRFELQVDKSKHVVLERTIELDSPEYFEDLNRELADQGGGLLVFIHGYNVSFEDAARRTAQMSHDLEFEGAPVFYSWPSQANWWEYQLDKKNIELSVNQIKSFLLQLAEKSQASTINLVAHSMGNVGLTEALAEIQATGESALFNQVVLAAPDIDADIFRSRIAPNIVGKAKRLTLYTSNNDLALVASRFFNAGRRAGESSGANAIYSGFDVIDASAVDMSLLGHSYYGDSVGVLQDLSELLMDRPAAERSYLRTANANGQPFWIIEDPLMLGQKPKQRPTITR